MSRPTVIDADGHVQEKYIRWEDYLEEPYRSQAPRVVKDNRGVDFLMVEGKLWPKPSGPGVGNVGAGYSRRPQATTGMADPVQRIKDMDLEGIDTAVLFGTNVFLSLAYYEDTDNACALARAYNDWLAEYCSQDRDRLKWEQTLPFVLDFVGHDRLVFASDYNHGDCKFPYTVSSMLERKDLPEGAMNRIMNENARRLYRL